MKRTGILLFISLVMSGVRGQEVNVGETRRITLTNGVQTDATLIGPDQAPVKLVWGHGLGSKDPELRTRFNDVASNVTFSAMSAAGARLVCYDARGHGSSGGWEERAEEDRDQFSWPHLARDMARVGPQYGLEKVVLGGSSMGSASALYAALQQEEEEVGVEVVGLLLVRPPTAWEERLARRPQLMEAARDLHKAKPESPYYNVLLGSAISDLPPHQALHHILDIPVLILTAEGDPTHPVTTARQLESLSPDTSLVVSESYEAGKQEWPQHIATFLNRF